MKLNPATTALITLDLQHGIVNFAPESAAVIAVAAKTVTTARANGYKIIHVGLGFLPGHPEISAANSRFTMIKQNNLFVKGSDSAQFYPSILAHDDIILYKHRFSAFAGNSLQMILQANSIEHLVLLGISTSGIVLSTLRQAFDLDFKCTVIKDACYDHDEEVHRVLTEKVFSGQAAVITGEQFEQSFREE